MKTLALLVLLSGVAVADQAAESFGTGFAQALQQQLYNQQQAQQNQPQRNDYPAGYYDIRDNYGELQGYKFESLNHCKRYIQNLENRECYWVGN